MKKKPKVKREEQLYPFNLVSSLSICPKCHLLAEESNQLALNLIQKGKEISKNSIFKKAKNRKIW